MSDNCSQDDTRDVVSSYDDARIRYLNTGRRLSMSDNWEFALSHVGDGWVTILGDDDGLLPDALRRAAAIAMDTGVQAIRSSVCAYQWPSLTGLAYGKLQIPTRQGIEIRNSTTWLERVMDARASYLDLPMLYNGGFVDVAVLRALRDRTGRCYRSCIPDVYMAIAIASVLDRYAYSRAPLAINGASRHSTGSSQFSGQAQSGATPAARFVSEPNLPFHPDLPLMEDGHYPPSFQVLVYESWLQTAGLRKSGVPAAGLQPMHRRQLELILATAGRFRSEIHAWGRSFADLHGIDFDRALAAAARTRLRRRPRLLLTRVQRKLGVHKAGSAAVTLGDVYAASCYAAESLNRNIKTGI